MNEIGQRLREARKAAGFETARLAATRFGWPYSTYAGHENSHRGIKRPDLDKYAQAFGVSVAWLITGKPVREEGQRADTDAAPRQAGFRESPVIPFAGKSDTERRQYRDIARILAPDARHVSLHVLGQDYPGYMLEKGDLLIVNLHPQPCDGQLVIAQVAHQPSGEVTTEIAQYLQGILAPPRGATGDFSEFAIVGTIEASVRRYD